MLKITKAIVNGQRNLIGFMIKGKESEMGGMSNNVIERGYPIDHMIKTKFSNSQISTVSNKLTEKGSFKINELPMVVYNPNAMSPADEYIEVDNTINLIGRYVQNNENIGFRVQFSDGSEDNMKYANVILICKWFRPGNFSIRHSSTGNLYICGKKDGISLADLPATIIGEKPEVTPKKMKSAAKAPQVKFNGSVESGFDILDIYGFIKDCNGAVIKLPTEGYVAASEKGETVTEGFTSLGIGEVASPVPLYNATKLNVNAGFKKVGIVPVAINGQVTNVTSFVFRSKSLFLKGENYMKKFGIAVPTDKAADLLKQLGASLAIEQITDPAIINPLSQVINVKNLSFYTVDSSKIDLISEKKREASIMSAKQLVELCKKQYELKLLSKALGPKGGILKELKAGLTAADVAEATGKKLFGIFSMMNSEALDAISAAGIDIYTGAYTVPGKPVVSSKKESDESVDTDIEIEYTLAGFDAGKLTGSKIIEAVKANDTTKVPEGVIKYVKAILDMSDAVEAYNAAKKLYDATEAKLTEISKKFWMHNASMYIAGNKNTIHTHDAKQWVASTSTRVKTANVYECKAKGAEGLSVKCKGVTI